MGRLYDPEARISFEVDDQGQPATLVWKQREPVRDVVNRWRVDDDWWRVPISRTYYTVRTPTALLEIYEVLHTGAWHLQRVID